MKLSTVLLSVLLLVSISAANNYNYPHAPDRILIYFGEDTDLSHLSTTGNSLTGIPEIDNLSEYYSVESIEKLFDHFKMLDYPGYIDLSRWYVVHFPVNIPVRDVVEAFKECKAVRYAEPDYAN